MRLLNFCVVVLLVVAAAYVYEIKFDATLRASRVSEMRGEVRRESDAIASYGAEWARLKIPDDWKRHSAASANQATRVVAVRQARRIAGAALKSSRRRRPI